MRTPIENSGDDQRYFTTAYLDVNIRKKFQIKLDYESEVIENLYASAGDVELVYNETTRKYFLKNNQTGSVPCILHGNGPAKPFLADISKYLMNTFETDVRKNNKSLKN